MSDALINAIAMKDKIRFIYADVTIAAKALEARHLAGPTAGMVLAEGLTAVALLSCDASREEESVTLQLKTSGPVTGLLVEAFANGDMRGYTSVKIMNDLDIAPDITTQQALGKNITGQIVKSIPGKTLNQARIAVETPSIKTIVAKFFNHSMQTPTAVEIHARSDAGGIISARGIIAERMPDGNPAAFLRVLEAFDDGSVQEHLTKSGALQRFEDVFKINNIAERESRHLQFRCRCSRQKAETSLITLSTDDLKSMLNDGQPHSVHCHMCGEDYSINTDTLKQIMDSQQSEGE